MAKAQAISGLDSQAPTAQNARAIVRERFADMYSYAQYVDNHQHTREWHDLRIAAKRVRYTLEVFAEFLPEECIFFAEELATLQEELGELHDSEVMLSLLNLSLHPEQAQTLPVEGRKPLLPPDLIAAVHNPTHTPSTREQQGLIRFLLQQKQRYKQSYRTFRQHWDRLEQNHFRRNLLDILEREEAKEHRSEFSPG